MTRPVPLAVAVLGLGEAGARIAADLVAGGGEVRGWDPVVTPVGGVERAAGPADAVTGAELVLGLSTAAPALDAASSVAPALAPGQVYADLNTTAPGLKADLAAVVQTTGAAFADVALLGPVPNRGIRTPALASGDGAARFAELVRPLGMPVEIVGDAPGDAAGMKLVRSVFMKGLAAAVLESLDAAGQRGVDDWLRGEIAAVLGEPLLDRLVTGTVKHAARRLDEMDAAVAYLEELGAEPRIARATAALLAELAAEEPQPR